MTETAVELGGRQDEGASTQIQLASVISVDGQAVSIEVADGALVSAILTDEVEDTVRRRGRKLVGKTAVVSPIGSRPVIIGFLSRDPLAESGKGALRKVSESDERIHLTAEKEVLLTCGKSEIRLTADGKVIVKGTDVVSRASRRNRIKGSTVGIN